VVEGNEAALTTFEELGLPVEISKARIAYGTQLRHFGELERARTQLELARSACERMEATGLLALAEEELANTVRAAR
jgi:hypothetical protein